MYKGLLRQYAMQGRSFHNGENIGKWFLSSLPDRAYKKLGFRRPHGLAKSSLPPCNEIHSRGMRHPSRIDVYSRRFSSKVGMTLKGPHATSQGWLCELAPGVKD
jgi:hypothetical protein